MTSGAAADRVISALTGRGSAVRETNGQMMAQCPAHNDHNPSLSIRAVEGQVLIYCFAGCQTGDVLAALGMTEADLYDERSATYRYEDGRTVRRRYDKDGKKRFAQNGHRSNVVQLYRLSRVTAAVTGGTVVHLVEGEKDVHALESVGAVATTAPMGAGNFDKVDVSPLTGACVVAVVDRDEAGDRWAQTVRNRLGALATSLTFVHAAAGKDAADHVAAGHGLHDFALYRAVPDEPTGYHEGDPWEGVTDEEGFPLEPDDVYGDDIAPHVTGEAVGPMTAQEAIAARFRLPEEFWGSREIFKRIRQAAWASQTHPDAVLACVLARAAAAIGHEVKFDSGRGPHGTLSLFVCLLARSGIGKSEAANAAATVMRLPRHLTNPDGSTDMEVFRDGLGIGTGEGLAEVFMGTVERDTGRMKPAKRGQQPEPETEKVRAVVRHRAYFYVDEGETLTKLMRERQGATLGPALRTAWTGGTLGQANARDETTRFVPRGQYAMGIAIGYQPDTAVAMLADVGPGTPQRFLWFGAQDTEMPAEQHEWPEPVTLPLDDMPTGCIHFPPEIKSWLRSQTRSKHLGEVEVDPMDAHEPLMRAKLAALLAYLDGRMTVARDDWTLGGQIWSVSKSIRDRLIRERDAAESERRTRERTEKISIATEIEVMKVQVTSDVERVARRIDKHVREAEEKFETVKRYLLRKSFGRDREYFDVALTHAKALGWVVSHDDDATLEAGKSRPA
jgi:hypothetical protein